jgi:hypothetical protein
MKPFQVKVDRSEPIADAPTHSELYVYKRCLRILTTIEQSEFDKSKSFLDSSVVRDKAVSSQVYLAEIQRKYPDFFLSRVDEFIAVKALETQTELF